MVRSGLSVLGPLVVRKRIVLGPAVSRSHHQGALLLLSHCWRSIWAQGLPLSPPRMCRGPTEKVQQRLLLYWCYLGSSGRNHCEKLILIYLRSLQQQLDIIPKLNCINLCKNHAVHTFITSSSQRKLHRLQFLLNHFLPRPYCDTHFACCSTLRHLLLDKSISRTQDEFGFSSINSPQQNSSSWPGAQYSKLPSTSPWDPADLCTQRHSLNTYSSRFSQRLLLNRLNTW